MSKIRLLSLAVLSLLVLNLGLLSFMFFNRPMRPPMDRAPEGREGPKRLIIERLHFSRQQAEQYDALIEEHQGAIKTLNDEMRTTKNNLYATLNNNAPSQKDSLLSRLGEIQKQIESVHYTHFEAIRKICTPDQVDNFKDLTRDLAGFFAPGKNPPRPSRD